MIEWADELILDLSWNNVYLTDKKGVITTHYEYSLEDSLTVNEKWA